VLSVHHLPDDWCFITVFLHFVYCVLRVRVIDYAPGYHISPLGDSVTVYRVVFHLLRE